VSISVGGADVVDGPTAEFRDVWEETSFALERLQAAPEVSAVEQQGLRFRMPPRWRMSFVPEWTAGIGASGGAVGTLPPDAPKVAILREEGSNGDREMAAAVHAAGAPCHLDAGIYADSHTCEGVRKARQTTEVLGAPGLHNWRHGEAADCSPFSPGVCVYPRTTARTSR